MRPGRAWCAPVCSHPQEARWITTGRNDRRASRAVRSCAGTAALLLGVLCGCQTGDPATPGGGSELHGTAWPAGLRDDVTEIVQIPQSPPWIMGDDGRVRGLKVLLYFVSAASGKGEFVGGPIAVQLRVFRPQPDGTIAPEIAHEWRFDWRAAAGFRVRTRAVMGDSYGFLFAWPNEMILDGEELQLIYSYERRDGQRVLRSGSRLRVPLPAIGSPAERADRARRARPAPGDPAPSSTPRSEAPTR